VGRGAACGPFHLEKWYLDVLAPDGTVLIVYVGWLSLLGGGPCRVLADLFRPGEPPRSAGARGRRPRGGAGALDLGAARLDGEGLRLATPGLEGRLRWRARHPAAALGAPFLRAGRGRLDWVVQVPDADVAGELRWPGGGMELRGRGYCDRVSTDIPLWRLPVRELTWGRIAAGDHASTWAEAITTGGRVGAGWVDGREAPPEACRGSLGPPRLLVDAGALDRAGLRLGPARALLRRLARDPHETKWACEAALGGARGVAIHERVRWS